MYDVTCATLQAQLKGMTNEAEDGDQEPDSDNDEEYQDLGAVKLGSEEEEDGGEEEDQEEEEEEQGAVPLALRNKDEVRACITAAV